MTTPSQPDQQLLRSTMTRRSLVTSAATIAAGASAASLFSTQPLAQSSTPKETIMSAEQFAEVVRRGYHGFNTADMALLTQVFDANSTWETPGKSPIAGLRKGRDNVFAHFGGTYGKDTDGTFKAELQFVTADANGRVVGVHRNAGTRKGRTLDSMCCIVFLVKDGRIVSGKEHFLDLHNWDAFWA
jgi:ketosteroid isomerase-like protein